MEHYRKNLKIRITLFGVIILIFVGILLYNQFGASAALKDSLAFSFQCGFSAAGALVLVFWMMKYRGALRDESKLRLFYNEENDERMKLIRAKAGVPMVLILSMALVLAGMIIGYWNETAFVVLIGVALFQLLVSLGVKIIYRNKM
jgi:hypothetical protein